MRVAIVSKSLGVYLGSCLGLGFWSKLDSAGQSSAVTFADESEASAHVYTWRDVPADYDFVPVEADDGVYATAAACERAGLGNWMTFN